MVYKMQRDCNTNSYYINSILPNFYEESFVMAVFHICISCYKIIFICILRKKINVNCSACYRKMEGIIKLK